MASSFVRIPGSLLTTLHAYHVATVVEYSAGNPALRVDFGAQYAVYGSTEWAADWLDVGIFLMWEWGVVMDAIVVLKPDEIRSNVLVITEGAHSPVLTKIHLFEWIESLPWRKVVADRALHSIDRT